MDGGLKTKETQALFNIIYPEGVSSFRGRLISIRRSKTLQGRAVAGGRPGQSLPRRHAMGTAAKLTGALGFANPCTNLRKEKATR